MVGTPLSLVFLGERISGVLYFEMGANRLLSARLKMWETINLPTLMAIPLFVFHGNNCLKYPELRTIFYDNECTNGGVVCAGGGIGTVLYLCDFSLAMSGHIPAPPWSPWERSALPKMLERGLKKKLPLGPSMPAAGWGYLFRINPDVL